MSNEYILSFEGSQQSVDFYQVFASLANHFEACCQVAPRKETILSVENKQNPLNGWIEFNKGRRWRHTAKGMKSSSDKPDFHAIFKKMKAEFARKSSATTAAESYSTWLVSGTRKPAAEVATVPVTAISPGSSMTQNVTEQFNAIVDSDASSWLQSTTRELPPQTLTLLTTADDVSAWLHSSPTGGSQDVQPAEVLNTIAGMNTPWLSPSRATGSVVPQQDAAKVFNVIANTSLSWLSSTSKRSEDGPQQDAAKVFNTIGDMMMSWLAPSPAIKRLEDSRREDVAEAFNIGASMNMPWVASSSSRVTGRQDPAEAYSSIACTSMSSWLRPSVTYISDDISMPQCSTMVETFDTIATTDASAWLQSAPSSQYPATEWLQQSQRNPFDQDYSDWMLHNTMTKPQEGWESDRSDQWLMPRCECYATSPFSVICLLL